MRATIILAAFALVIVLSACGGAATATPTPSPTPSPVKEWNLEGIQVDGTTITVSLHVFAGIDVQATLDGKAADEVRPTIPTIEYVFLNVAPGQHTVEVRDVVGFSETAEVVVAPPTPLATPTATATPTSVSIPGFDVPFPNIYGGMIFVGGQPAPDGLEVFARIEDYQTPIDPEVTVVENGRYRLLIIGPPSTSFFDKQITFHAILNGQEVQAQETATFQKVDLSTQPAKHLQNTLDLHFPEVSS